MALRPCPECGREVSDRAPACPGCGCPAGSATAPGPSGHGGGGALPAPDPALAGQRPSPEQPGPRAAAAPAALAPWQMAGLAGGALLALGAFCPLVSLPLVGGVNLLGARPWEGLVVLVAGPVCAACAWARDPTFLFASSVAALAVIGSCLFRLLHGAAEPGADAVSEAAARLAAAAAAPQWGWLVLVAGGVTALAASLAGHQERTARSRTWR